MNVTPTAIPDVLLLEPKMFGDSRGFFYESFNQRAFEAAIGAPAGFVQDNHSRSGRDVLRGLHYQVEQPQGKLVRVVAGAVCASAVIGASCAIAEFRADASQRLADKCVHVGGCCWCCSR